MKPTPHPSFPSRSPSLPSFKSLRSLISLSPLALPIALLTCAAPLLTGCQVLTYRSATGDRLTRASFGSTTAISSLDIELSTNGLRRVELRGYQNDTAQALGTVTEAAVRTALSSQKP